MAVAQSETGRFGKIYSLSKPQFFPFPQRIIWWVERVPPCPGSSLKPALRLRSPFWTIPYPLLVFFRYVFRMTIGTFDKVRPTVLQLSSALRRVLSQLTFGVQPPRWVIALTVRSGRVFCTGRTYPHLKYYTHKISKLRSQNRKFSFNGFIISRHTLSTWVSDAKVQSRLKHIDPSVGESKMTYFSSGIPSIMPYTRGPYFENFGRNKTPGGYISWTPCTKACSTYGYVPVVFRLSWGFIKTSSKLILRFTSPKIVDWVGIKESFNYLNHHSAIFSYEIISPSLHRRLTSSTILNVLCMNHERASIILWKATNNFEP